MEESLAAKLQKQTVPQGGEFSGLQCVKKWPTSLNKNCQLQSQGDVTDRQKHIPNSVAARLCENTHFLSCDGGCNLCNLLNSDLDSSNVKLSTLSLCFSRNSFQEIYHSFKKIYKWEGWRDGAAGEGPCQQNCGPGFDSWDSNCRGREFTL